jgi:hypothetical protein
MSLWIFSGLFTTGKAVKCRINDSTVYSTGNSLYISVCFYEHTIEDHWSASFCCTGMTTHYNS